MFIVFFLVATLELLCVSESLHRLVKRCPLTIDDWQKREKVFPCNPQDGLFYHCFRTANDSMIELCQSLRIFSPSDGCPYLTLDGGFPSTSPQYDMCRNKNQRCPKASDGMYKSNTIYKYDGCLRPYETTKTPILSTSQVEDTTTKILSENYQLGDDLDVSSTAFKTVTTLKLRQRCCSETVQKNDAEMQGGGFVLSKFHIALVVIGVMLAITIFVATAAIYFYKRMKTYKKKLQRITYTTMSSVSTEEGRAHSYCRVYNEIPDTVTPPGSMTSGYEEPNPFVKTKDSPKLEKHEA